MGAGGHMIIAVLTVSVEAATTQLDPDNAPEIVPLGLVPLVVVAFAEQLCARGQLILARKVAVEAAKTARGVAFALEVVTRRAMTLIQKTTL